MAEGARLIERLRVEVAALEAAGTPLVMTLDSKHDLLARAAELFFSIEPSHLQTEGAERDRNLRTWSDLRRLCNLG